MKLKTHHSLLKTISGFTLIELLIVMGITAILASVTLFGSGLFGFKQDKDLSLSADAIVATLRAAQTNASSQEGGTAWGVRFVNPASGVHYYQLFSGSSYSPANVKAQYLLSGATTFTMPTSSTTQDVIFSAATGRPLLTAVIVLVSAAKPNAATVAVNSSGVISYLADRGLVGYWSFDGTGTTAADTSDNGNTGAMFSGATSTDLHTGVGCKLGRCASFDGVDDYVNAGNSASLQITQSYTLGAWLNPTSSAGIQRLVSKWSGAAGYFLTWTEGGNATVRVLAQGATQGYRDSATTIPLNQWSHIVGVYNSSSATIDIYINGTLSNGILTGTVPSSITDSGGNLFIGSAGPTASFTNGRIDEVRVYNRALSAGEVRAIYNATR